MAHSFEIHKKGLILFGAALAGVLLIAYLCAFFQQGIWYGSAFLYEQENGSFQGSDAYGDYRMEIEKTDGGEKAAVRFSVSGKQKEYEITGGMDEVRISENGTLLFEGSAMMMGDYYILLNDSNQVPEDMIEIQVGDEVPDQESLYPSCSQLYTWVMTENHDSRGNPAMLICIGVMAVFLALDIAFPRLFFFLAHGLAVEGGEPSDWYWMGQKIGRVVLSLGILICMVLSFTVH